VTVPEPDEPLIHQVARQARAEAEMDQLPAEPDEEYDPVAEHDPEPRR
jgi:hypothetical protein